MFRVSRNHLIVQCDGRSKRLKVDRFRAGLKLEADSVINTEYSLSKLKATPLGKAARLLGADILIGLDGTRKALVD